jgi:high-affinity iron transporter
VSVPRPSPHPSDPARGGNHASLQLLLVISTCFLYLVAAGLFSKAVGDFEVHKWNTLVGGDISEVGTGPGSYDIRQSVWHVNVRPPPSILTSS